MTNDPTQGGLGITHDPPDKPRDVFDYVRRELAKDKAHGDAAIEPAVDEFIEKARELFTHNRAIAQDTMSETLALRFQDGSVLTFCDVPSGMDGVGNDPGAMQIAKDHPPRGQDGKGRTVPTPSWGVSTGEQGTT